MRTPERCPWCGAEPTDGEPSPYWGDQDYRCGAEMVGSEWACTCPDRDTPAAVAYRTALAWRKRLSQHTGVPLRMIPTGPEWFYDIAVSCAAAGAYVIAQFRSPAKTVVVERGRQICAGRHSSIQEARRRLLAVWESKTAGQPA